MPTVTCVLHHHIGSVGPFEEGLNIATTPRVYRDQINWMALNFDIISLGNLLSGDLPKRPLLLTFDDAYSSVVDVVREVLAPKGLPCVYFVNPSLLEKGAISLDNTLAWSANTYGIEAVCRLLDLPLRAQIGDVVVRDMAQYSSAEREDIRDKLLCNFGQPDFSGRAALMTADDLRDLTRMGVEIGNHSNTHVHCRSLTAQEHETEIIDAKRRLETLSGQKVRSFSVPYGSGDDLTDPVLKTLRSSGHEAIFLVEARSNRWRPARDIWYRSSLHNETEKQLKTRIIRTPILRSLKRRVQGYAS